MSNQDDLQNIRRQVDMYFDQVLSRQDSKTLLERVKTDPVYHRVFTQEKMMREAIRSSVHRPSVTPDLINTIKNNIRMG